MIFMKKIVCIIMITIIFVTISAFAASEIKVFLNDRQLTFDVQPQIVNGRTLVPMRTIFEALGANVSWDDKNKMIIANSNSSIIILKINSSVMVVKNLSADGESKISLDVPPQIVNGRTLVPVRAISESFGAQVGWNNETKTVTITK